MGRARPHIAIGYRSHDLAVLAEWATWQDALLEHQANVRAFKLSVDPEDRLALHARRNIVPVYFSGDFVPKGWRRGRDGYMFPDKRLKAGKEADARMEALRKAAPLLSLSGMPERAFVGDHLYEMGAFKHDSAIYAYWGGVPEDVDLKVWTELKLSEFYAAQEAYDPKEQA